MEGADLLGVWATDFSGWGFGLPWDGGGGNQRREDFGLGEVHDTVAGIRRFLFSFFRFCFARILLPTPAMLPCPSVPWQ